MRWRSGCWRRRALTLLHIIPGYVQLQNVSAHLHSDLPLTPEEVRAMSALRLMLLSDTERHFKPGSRSFTKAAQLEMVG
jgi:hypothetical protein